jgi:hypothetical protein
MNLELGLSWTAALIGALAAGLACYASTKKIRNSLDQFWDDMQVQARWLSYAAIANAVATTALILSLIFR